MSQIPVHARQFFWSIYGEFESHLKDQSDLSKFLVIHPAAKRVGVRGLPAMKHQRWLKGKRLEMSIEFFSLQDIQVRMLFDTFQDIIPPLVYCPIQ
jgi:hypothetical protein